MDMFLVDGVDWLFSVAVALLKNARKDLLTSSFEEMLQYFRVTLPRGYQTNELATSLIGTAVGLKVS